jgi:hypothetical protein
LVLDIVPSSGELATQVYLARVAGVVVDNQPQISLLAW